MSSVRLSNLGMVYPDGSEAVRDVDVTIGDGEFFVIVGPSGCGKTTVLRLVAGLEEPTTGEILIDDVRVNEMGPRQRDIAFAFQQHALYPHMTVAENLAFSLRLAKVGDGEITERVAEVAELLDIDDLLDRQPNHLSGGQQQRVALGRSLIREPRLLLMDEPMSNLDASLRIESRAQLLTIQRRLRTTTVYVTHDQVEAMSMADRIAVMRGGSIVQLGPPTQLYEHPDDIFVAQFVGAPPMSVVRATVARAGDALALQIGSHELRLDDVASLRRRVLAELVGRHVAVGLRPEALHRDERGELIASVAFTELLGRDRLIHATIDARSVTQDDGSVSIGADRHSMVATYVDAHEEVDPWKPLILRVDVDTLHLFDISTGARLGLAE